MKALLVIAALAATPAMAQTAPQPAPAPQVQSASKSDKPFVYDSARKQLPPKPAPKDHAGPGVG